jgi:hypothetical protein
LIEDRTVARLGWSIPLATVLLTSTIHIISGNYRDFPFFISEADYPGLERIIFKGGFFLNGLVLIYVSWLIYSSCKSKSRWYMIHISGVLGVLVGINLSLMAIWDIYDYERLHVFTASNVFQLGLVWGIVTHIGLPDADIRNKRLRYISISTSILAFLGMIYSISLGLEKYPEFVDGNWDLNKMQPWIDWAAPLEYLMVFSFMLTLKSFEQELENKED